jgi:amino acid transporter
VNLWISSAVILAAVIGAVTLMYLARRRAPEGGYFTDLDRAAGVFGVLGTSFAVLLAFVIFVAFESYGNAKGKAGQEAVSVVELYYTAQLFPSPARAELTAQMVCYGRSVIDDEWPAMRHQRQSRLVDGWLTKLDATVERERLAEQQDPTAFEHWLDQSASRREGRRGRLAEASPFVPRPLWFALLIGAVLLVVFMCFFADRSEAFFVQAMMIGSITTVVVTGLLVIRFLDRPYENHSGGIKPVAMTDAVNAIERQRDPGRTLCDEGGRPRRS